MLLAVALLAGCEAKFTAVEGLPSTSSEAIGGTVYGGRQPIAGAHIYAFSVATVYGGASVSLLDADSAPGYPTASDGTNYYVTTDSNGMFQIAADTTCSNGYPVYLYSSGGDAGSGANSAAGLMATVGVCAGDGLLQDSTGAHVSMNEVSTIATAYSFAGYAVDPTHIGGDVRVQLDQASYNAAQLYTTNVTMPTGARSTTPGGNGTVPQSEINTLGNILAACVNTSGPSSPACSALLADIKSNGTSGTVASDTAAAAIYIAQNPWANVGKLFNVAGSTAFPYTPALSAAPNDYTIALTFTGGGLNSTVGIAIDPYGSIWITNEALGASSVTKLSTLGVPLSGASGFTGGGLDEPTSISLDLSGNAWIINNANYTISNIQNNGTPLAGSGTYSGGGLHQPGHVAVDGNNDPWFLNSNNSLTKLSSSGSAISGSGGYTGGGLHNPSFIAFNGSSNAWIVNNGNASLSVFFNSGTSVFGSNALTGGGLDTPYAVALDASGVAWITNFSVNSLSAFGTSGQPTSGSNGYTGGGLSQPTELEIDGNGNVWVANFTGSVSEFSNSGVAISGSAGLASGFVGEPYTIAIDGAGDVWLPSASNFVTELIGAAAPVITPLALAVKENKLGTRP